MEDKTVPYLVYEGTQARNERTIKRLIIVIVVTILLLFASNALWLYEWCQYDYEAEEIIIDSRYGSANYVGRDGDAIYGMDIRPTAKETP